MFYTYILKSKLNGKLYIGVTQDLKRRFTEHKNGKVWTTKRMLPVELIFYEGFICKGDAVRRERYFKKSKGKASLKMLLRLTLKK